MLSCAFTGHRPQFFPWGYNENDSRCIELRAVLYRQINALVHEGYTDFLCGMALGVDTWTAQAVLLLRKEHPELKLHCILPCVGQENYWTEQAKVRYVSIIKQADSRVYTSRRYYKNCMIDRNKFMVDHANLLFAIYGGNPKSGTAFTVSYARKQGKRVMILDPWTHRISHAYSD